MTSSTLSLKKLGYLPFLIMGVSMNSVIGKLITANSRLIYLVAFLGGVLLLILSHLLGEEYVTSSEVMKEVGMAVLVSVFLSFTIEGIAKQRHEASVNNERELLSRGIFEAIYKRHIPEVVFEEVERCVLNSRIIREQYKVAYTIKDLDEKELSFDVPCSNYVRCFVTTSYVLRNLTSAPVTQDIVLHLEKPLEARLIPLVKIENVRIDGDALSAQQIKDATKMGDSQINFLVNRDIPPNGSIKVSIKAALIKYSTDQEIWSSRIPSDGIELTVNVPDDNLEVCVKANHSQKLILSTDDKVMKQWNLDHGIFPHQSLLFWWHPKGKKNACPYIGVQ